MPNPGKADDHFFDECVRSLAKYRDDHGNLDVSSGYADAKGHKLGQWLYRIRRSYQEGQLRQDRFDKLLRVGYDVRDHPILTASTPKKKTQPPRSPPAAAAAAAAIPSSSAKKKAPGTDNKKPRAKVDTWNDYYDRLVRFKEEHGHLLPEYSTHKALRSWLKKQTDLWRYGKLHEDRAEWLRQLGVPEPEPDPSSDEDDDERSQRCGHNGYFEGGQPGDEFAVWGEPGISTRSAKKKRKLEAEAFLSDSDEGAAAAAAAAEPQAKRAAKGSSVGEAAAVGGEADEPAPPSFLSCMYQAVAEKVSSYFFAKPAAA